MDELSKKDMEENPPSEGGGFDPRDIELNRQGRVAAQQWPRVKAQTPPTSTVRQLVLGVLMSAPLVVAFVLMSDPNSMKLYLNPLIGGALVYWFAVLGVNELLNLPWKDTKRGKVIRREGSVEEQNGERVVIAGVPFELDASLMKSIDAQLSYAVYFVPSPKGPIPLTFEPVA